MYGLFLFFCLGGDISKQSKLTLSSPIHFSISTHEGSFAMDNEYPQLYLFPGMTQPVPLPIFRSNRKYLVDGHGDRANGRNTEVVFYLQDDSMVPPGH